MRETIEVSGIRCERCVMRLARTLEGHDGLEFANATLLGTVTVVYDDARTSREALLGRLERGGFPVRPELSGNVGDPGHGRSHLAPRL